MTIKPTCFDCKHSEIDNGYSPTREDPGSPPSAECGLYDRDPEYYDRLIDLPDCATHCKTFVAKPAGDCGNCGLYIEAPKWSWGIKVENPFDSPIPVCSSQCRSELSAAIDREMEETFIN